MTRSFVGWGTRRLYAASSVDARGNGGGIGGVDRGIRRADRAQARVAQKHLAPLRRLGPALEHAAIDERPAIEIVIDLARQDEAVDQRRVEEQFLEPLQRAEPDQVAAADAHQ